MMSLMNFGGVRGLYNTGDWGLEFCVDLGFFCMGCVRVVICSAMLYTLACIHY